MKKVPLADVLWEAANRQLNPVGDGDGGIYDTSYSCVAVWSELCRAGIVHREFNPVWEFLDSLGCKSSSSALRLNAPRGEKRQGNRYMWLLLAMHVAEDEKIMVEVA